ncbi:MAG: radical SAM protein [Syntrophaceae bacterium]|nr:radical SAM protein [Syntrophaceae bacterium]
METSFYIQWHITNACHLRCRHCYQVDFTRREDLGWEGLKEVSENILVALRAWKDEACIHLTGGEPLLKGELSPLLDHLNRQPEVKELGLITNGLLLNDEILDRFSAIAKFKTIKISLDGADAQTHDHIRTAGNFERVMEKISLIQERGSFDVNLMFTVMKSNLDSLPDFLRLGEELRVEGLIIERFIPLGRGRAIQEEVLDKFQWRRMLRALLAYFSMELEENEIPSYQAFQIDFRGREPQLLGAPCVLGTEGFCVMPNADVFPCRRFPLAIGNLLTNSLNNILKTSEIIKQIRVRGNLKGKCRTCDREDCTGCRSLAFSVTGDPFAEDPHCWYTASPE